jgi:hypothetical protein
MGHTLAGLKPVKNCDRGLFSNGVKIDVKAEVDMADAGPSALSLVLVAVELLSITMVLL